VRPEDDLTTAGRHLAESVLWNMRVLGGWVPPAGADLLRALAGWFEISNVESHAAADTRPPYRLGALATAWPRLALATSVDDLRAELAASPWGDPGGTAARDIQLALRASWAERVSARVALARPWAAGALLLLVAREHLARQHPIPDAAATIIGRVIGTGAMRATTLADLSERAAAPGQWVLADVARVEDLWRGEVTWWRRLRTDGTQVVTQSGFSPDQVVGAVALLAVDAWRTRGALEVADRGAEALEVFDGLA
jgi:hypothetical protein